MNRWTRSPRPSSPANAGRLVKGAKVLGEDDARETNVDNIELPDEEDENPIQLDI